MFERLILRHGLDDDGGPREVGEPFRIGQPGANPGAIGIEKAAAVEQRAHMQVGRV